MICFSGSNTGCARANSTCDLILPNLPVSDTFRAEMAPKPPKPKAKQDNRVLTPARRAVLYDQWLGGRSLEELSAKWRKPIHRINEALTMERAERKVAQAIKDSNERKANHEVAIEPPREVYDFDCPREPFVPDPIEGDIIRCEPIATGIPISDPGAAFDAIDKALPAAITPADIEWGLKEMARLEPERVARPVADLIEDAIKRRLGS